MTPLVSILVPAYRAERFLTDTVRCVRAQTWTRKEIIIVDDGSPDRTYEVAKSLEGPDLKVVRQENAGAPAARNTALSLAQGEYIQWLDADDLLHPEKIRLQLVGASDGLSSPTLLTCSWGKFFHCTDRAVFKPDALWCDLSPVDWLITKFRDNVWMNPAVWLVSRRLTELAGPWDQRLARSGDDDGEYLCRLVARSDQVRFVPAAICYYRIGTVGSLNWNMGVSDETLESLTLCLAQCVGHLLALEDTERTRAACRQFLATFLPYYYGQNAVHFEVLAAIARDLGFHLDTPSVAWKYRPIEWVAGPDNARKVIRFWRGVRIMMRRRYDELRCGWSRTSG